MEVSDLNLAMKSVSEKIFILLAHARFVATVGLGPTDRVPYSHV